MIMMFVLMISFESFLYPLYVIIAMKYICYIYMLKRTANDAVLKLELQSTRKRCSFKLYMDMIPPILCIF